MKDDFGEMKSHTHSDFVSDLILSIIPLIFFLERQTEAKTE